MKSLVLDFCFAFSLQVERTPKKTSPDDDGPIIPPQTPIRLTMSVFFLIKWYFRFVYFVVFLKGREMSKTLTFLQKCVKNVILCKYL